MSDDFDREAEREKLREKYERDQEKREATEQMSELLLQGATMTNQHCPECHSPVFRYDGTSFCPTCQREVTEEGEFAGDGADGAGETSDGERPPADAATNGDAAEAAESAAPADVDEQSSTGADGTAVDADSRPTEPEASAGPRDDEPAETRPAPARERRPARVDPPARREEPRRGRESTPTESGDLGEAEAALVREITNLTRRAAETSDLGRKRDFFAAAREATETLRELRRL